MRLLTLTILGFLPLFSHAQNIDFPKPTSEENGFKGPVKTVYELEYECPNYVEVGGAKRIMVIGFLPNQQIDFKEFYSNGKVYIRLDYEYQNDKLVQRLESYKAGDYSVLTEYKHGKVAGKWEERTYLDDEMVSLGKYEEGTLVDFETYDGERVATHARYDVENGMIHHINDDEMHPVTGEVQMRWETDFTYENEKLKQKVHFVKDYIYYKNTFEYHSNGELKQALSVDNLGDTIYLEIYHEFGKLKSRLDTKSINGEKIVHSFEYDEENNLISRTSSSMFHNDTTWSYNSDGKLITETVLRDNEKVGQRKWIYENGLITECTGTGIENYTIYYSYDKYGNCTKEMTVSEDAPVHVLYRRIYYHKK